MGGAREGRYPSLIEGKKYRFMDFYFSRTGSRSIKVAIVNHRAPIAIFSRSPGIMSLLCHHRETKSALRAASYIDGYGYLVYINNIIYICIISAVTANLSYVFASTLCIFKKPLCT